MIIHCFCKIQKYVLFLDLGVLCHFFIAPNKADSVLQYFKLYHTFHTFCFSLFLLDSVYINLISSVYFFYLYFMWSEHDPSHLTWQVTLPGIEGQAVGSFIF